MSSDTAELSIPLDMGAAMSAGISAGMDSGTRSARLDGLPWSSDGGRERTGARRRRLALDEEQARAWAVAWRALLGSRLLVWAVGVGTVVAFGYGPLRRAFDPPGTTKGFGWLGNLLAAPAARWDSVWYLVIARFGYHPALGSYTSARDAFFPLYPLGLSGLAHVGVPAVLAGVLISLAALAAALYGIHRLTTLELGLGDGGTRAARLAVLLCAFAPMAFFLSAVYSESLYLALSVGLFWSARNGRWAWAGVLGALAGATRSAGLVLALPALMIYFYGPREDRQPDFVRAGRSRLLPRYRVRGEAAWLLLLPAGVVAYGAYLGLAGGDPLAPLQAQGEWSRHFAGPFVGAWEGLQAAFEGARQLLSFQRAHLYYPTGGESAFISAGHNLVQFAFLAAALPAVVGVLRRLPLAYGAYVIAALALPLSYPAGAQPLMSLPRFLLVLFPLAMWLGWWLCAHPRLQRPALLGSAALMALFATQFTTWHWVA